MSAHLIGPVFLLTAVALTVVIGVAHTAFDAWRFRRRARRLHTGPTLTLPRQETRTR